MNRHVIFLLCGLFTPVIAQTHLFWVDESCFNWLDPTGIEFGEAMEAALEMASITRRRLEDPNDLYMRQVFHRIFRDAPDRQTQVAHPAYQQLDSGWQCLINDLPILCANTAGV